MGICSTCSHSKEKIGSQLDLKSSTSVALQIAALGCVWDAGGAGWFVGGALVVSSRVSMLCASEKVK